MNTILISLNLYCYHSEEIIELFRESKLTTTIQIDDNTKKELFHLKLDLEKHRGEPISYNEVIVHLLNNLYRNINGGKHIKEFKKLRGSLPKDALNMYYEEKRNDLEKEEKIARLNKK